MYDLYSHGSAGQDLGIEDREATILNLTIGSRDFEVKQSLALLSSSLPGGTTGAVAWRSSVRLAGWLARTDNVLFSKQLLHTHSVVIELGSGSTGLVPMVLAPRVASIYCTDQPYVLKILSENIHNNLNRNIIQRIHLAALDWETDDVTYWLKLSGLQSGVEMIILSDVIYNTHLINPLVQVCEALCQARTADSQQTVILLVQHLREPTVFEEWLNRFSTRFMLRRIADEYLSSAELIPSMSHAVYLAVLLPPKDTAMHMAC